MNIHKKLKGGLKLQQSGQLHKAEGVFSKVLEMSPSDFVSLYSLGVIALQSGRYEEALGYIDRAIAVNPIYALTWINRCIALKSLNRDDEALRSYGRAMELDPSRNSGASNHTSLQSEAPAPPSYETVSAAPESMEDLTKRALDSHNGGRLHEAEELFRQILTTNPSDFVALYSMGVLAHQRGDSLEAMRYFDAVSKSNPGYAPIWYNRGAALQTLKRNDEALESYDRAISLDACYSAALVNRGAVLKEMSRQGEALETYNLLLGFDPDNDKALANKGILLTEFKRHDEAAETFAKLLQVNPEYENGLGLLCSAQMHACSWSELERRAAQIAAGIASGKRVTTTLGLLAVSDDSSEHLACAKIFTDHMYPSKEPLWCGEVYRHEKIRIAYVSPDFREHPVGYLMAAIFEKHDRSRFETIAVSIGIDDHSELRTRIAGSFDRFIDCRQKTTLDIAALMRSMEIDIAIDLAGYTADSRTDIFSYRPAPVQVNYLGYPSTLAVTYMDYILADRYIIPKENLPHFTEKVVYLPDSYLPTDASLKVADETPGREAFGLPAKGFVYCSFNHAYKINPAIFDVWMRILEKTPGSVLWLMKLSSPAEGNLRKEAAARGVDPARLIFATRVPRVEDHLARYRLADLFLDTTPYNAHTTASDALFVGLPVLTCLGKAFPGRVASGLLSAIGVPELITNSLGEYEELAIRLAHEDELLRGIEEKLKKNRSTHPLFDTVQFCRNLESAYLSMWRRSQEGGAPESLEVERG